MGSPASALFSHIGSAISNATSAGSTALGLSTALRAAADQHQRQVIAQQRQAQLDQQRSMEEEFKNRMQLSTAGADPMGEFNETKTPEGLVQRTPNPDFASEQQQGHIVTLPTASGKKETYHVPSKGEKGETFKLTGDLASALNEAGMADAKEGKEYPISHAGTLMGALKDHTKTKALDDDNSVTVDQKLADMLEPHGIKVKPGARISMEHLSNLKDLASIAEPKETPEKAKKAMHFERVTNDAGDVTTNVYDPETGEVVKTHVQKGIGAKRKDPDAPRAPVLTPGQAAVEKRNIRTAIRSETDRKTDLMRKAEEGFKKEATAAMGDPAKLQAAKDNLWKAKQQAQNDYEDATRELGQNPEHFDFGQQREGMKGGTSQQPAPAAKPAAAAPQKAASQPVAEGTFIKNPKTGERLMLRGGQWVPASK